MIYSAMRSHIVCVCVYLLKIKATKSIEHQKNDMVRVQTQQTVFRVD